MNPHKKNEHIEEQRISMNANGPKLRTLLPEVILGSIALFLLCLHIGDVPGIHYDEALIFFKVFEIAQGTYSLHGMSSYAGPLHQYLLLPFFHVFGYKIEVLRVVSACFNTAGLLLLMRLYKRLCPAKEAIYCSGLMLVTSPMLIMTSRYAGDVQSLNIFLSISAIWFLCKSLESTSINRLFCSFASGVLLALLVYNHILGVTLPAALGLTALVVFGFSVLKNKITWIVLAGIVAGSSIRIYQLIFQDLRAEWFAKASENTWDMILADLPNFPRLFSQMLDGTLLYLQFVGETHFQVVPYASIFLFAFFIARMLILKQKGLSDGERFFYIFFVLLIVLTLAMVPDFTPHYFILPVLFTNVLIILFAQPFFNYDTKKIRFVSRASFVFVVAFNLFYLFSNYFVRYLDTGGKVVIHNVGNRRPMASNNWVQVHRLYEELVGGGVRNFVADLSIWSPLEAWDGWNGNLTFIGSKLIGNEKSLKPKTAFILHDGENFLYAKVIKNLPPDEFKVGSVSYTRDKSFDHHFRVYIAEKTSPEEEKSRPFISATWLYKFLDK